MDKKKSNLILDTWKAIKKSFQEFLKVPSIIILCFLLLAFITNLLDHSKFSWLHPIRHFMKDKIFSDPKGTSSLLAALAGSLITVSSITITLLLIVVQQSASAMTTRVFDQFLRNKINQIYFGFFVGLTLYCLFILATVASPFNPVLGGSVAFLLTIVALYFLLLLIYTTVNEMRPPVIIEAIFQNILKAQKSERELLMKTKRAASFEGKISHYVKTETYGYLVGINATMIHNAIKSMKRKAEVIFTISIGDYLTVHDIFAEVKSESNEDNDKICDAVVKATDIQKQRKTWNDPGDAIEQLEMIAWTSVSTAKSNPYPGILIVRTIRNLLSVWDDEKKEQKEKPYPIVYNSQAKEKLFISLETLAVASSESLQHMVFAEILLNFSFLFNRLNSRDKKRVEDIILRIISCMGDHVFTSPLEKALNKLIHVLKRNNCFETADHLVKAKEQLQQSVGKLNSRDSRVGK
ncbi:MAG: DUF2254 family protein [Ginsengibacter sp.]